MAISHVLVLTPLDQEMEATQCYLTLRKVGVGDSWIIMVPEAGLSALDLVFQ